MIQNIYVEMTLEQKDILQSGYAIVNKWERCQRLMSYSLIPNMEDLFNAKEERNT